jgi:hypothetical protein
MAKKAKKTKPRKRYSWEQVVDKFDRERRSKGLAPLSEQQKRKALAVAQRVAKAEVERMVKAWVKAGK